MLAGVLTLCVSCAPVLEQTCDTDDDCAADQQCYLALCSVPDARWYPVDAVGDVLDLSSPLDRGVPDATGELTVEVGAVAIDACVVAVEVCNSADDDCDGQIDEGLLKVTVYMDADGDGFGTDPALEDSCLRDGLADVAGDCADDDRLRFPGATEVCDGVDQSCDGELDLMEADSTAVPSLCDFPHASARCDGEKCVEFRCDQGRINANEDESDGCERGCDGLAVGRTRDVTAVISAPALAVGSDGVIASVASARIGDSYSVGFVRDAGPARQIVGLQAKVSLWTGALIATDSGFLAALSQEPDGAVPRQSPLFKWLRVGGGSRDGVEATGFFGRASIAARPVAQTEAVLAVYQDDSDSSIGGHCLPGPMGARVPLMPGDLSRVLLASSAMPVVGGFIDGFLLAVADPEGQSLHLLFVNERCQVTAHVEWEVPNIVLSFDCVTNARDFACAANDGAHIVTVAGQRDEAEGFVLHDEGDFEPWAITTPPKLGVTGRGYLVFYGNGHQGEVLPIDFDGTVPAGSTPILMPSRGSLVDRIAVAPNPRGGLAVAWVNGPEQGAHLPGPVSIADLSCD